MNKDLIISNNNYNAYFELLGLKKNIRSKMKRKDRNFIIKGILFLVSFNSCLLLHLLFHMEFMFYIAFLLVFAQAYTIVDYSVSSYLNEIKPLKKFKNIYPLVDVDYDIKDLERCLNNYRNIDTSKKNNYIPKRFYDYDDFELDNYNRDINRVRKRIK